MKFVIKSLLLVNIVLQFTATLRNCFDFSSSSSSSSLSSSSVSVSVSSLSSSSASGNLMLTIVLLAFTVIGFVGLVLENRFVLLVYAVGLCLILIASLIISSISTSTPHRYSSKQQLTNPPIGANKRPAGNRKLPLAAWRKSQASQRPSQATVDTTNDDDSSQVLSSPVQSSRRHLATDGPQAKSRGLQLQRSNGDGDGDGNESQRMRLANLRHDTSDADTGDVIRSAQVIASPVPVDAVAFNADDSEIAGRQANKLRRTKPLAINLTSNINSDSNSNNTNNQIDMATVGALDDKISVNPSDALLADEYDAIDQAAGKQTKSRATTASASISKIGNVRHKLRAERNIKSLVSQCIDIVMHLILAVWLALLIDSDASSSDDCLCTSGRNKKLRNTTASQIDDSDSEADHRRQSTNLAPNSSASMRRKSSYNYNGKRYSIRGISANGLAAG